jgi:tellurium resistance protein TerD
MAVNLEKGSTVSLSKENAGLTKVVVGLGWNPSETPGVDFDLDASAFLLSANGRVSSDGDFVFYGNKFSSDGSVEGAEDDLTGGSSDGDDEEINIDLTKVSAQVDRIAITATIHEAASRGQNFGQVSDAYIRVVDASNGSEILRYDLSGDFARDDAVHFGELVRNGNTWDFRAVGEGKSNGLFGLCREFGVNVG